MAAQSGMRPVVEAVPPLMGKTRYVVVADCKPTTFSQQMKGMSTGQRDYFMVQQKCIHDSRVRERRS